MECQRNFENSELFIYGDKRYIANPFCKKCANNSDTLACVLSSILCKFFAPAIIVFYSTWCIEEYTGKRTIRSTAFIFNVLLTVHRDVSV